MEKKKQKTLTDYFPGGPMTTDSALPMQETQVPSLVRELDPCN